VKVKGKSGELTWKPHGNMQVKYDSAARELTVARPNDQRLNRALHGLTRSLLNNMVQGVTTPFEKKLEIVGVGYNASVKNKELHLQVGYANTVKLPIPAGITVEVPDNTHVTLKSCDKQAVGQFAAEVRRVRPLGRQIIPGRGDWIDAGRGRV
jgi:large subunit ribosomal protein L6